jgi:hypothetical protein
MNFSPQITQITQKEMSHKKAQKSQKGTKVETNPGTNKDFPIEPFVPLRG